LGYTQAPAATTDNYLYGFDRNGSAHTNPLMSDKSSLGTAGGALRACVNGVSVNPYQVGFSGRWDIVSVACYQRVYADSFTSTYTGSKYTYGGKDLGECLIFTNTLTAAEIKRVEAYLNQKWFGRETAGCRPQTVSSLVVDAGAELEVEGNRALTVGALESTGVVRGSLSLAEGATITLPVVDGAPIAPGVTGTLDVSRGGSVVLTGKVKSGTYDLGAASGSCGAWAVTGARSKGATLRVVDGRVVLNVTNGLVLVVR